MSASRTSVIIILLTLLTAMIGGWAGVTYGLRQARAPRQLDQMLHEELHLSATQNAQLETLESQFAVQRSGFETTMQSANRDIATAITVRHAYDADARIAIGRLHQAMIGLQQASVQHVLAMRAILSPDQASEFDRTVNQALIISRP